MPCNCGSKKTSVYVYTDSMGQQQEFQTLMAAKAAQIRAGGGGSVRVEEKVKK